MSYTVRVTGHITITPPIRHSDLATVPALSTPQHDRQAWIYCDEDGIETEDGTLLRRTGTRIVAYEDAQSQWTFDEDILAIVAAFPDRTYSGYFECLGEDSDRWRIAIRGGMLCEIRPVLTWPEDPEPAERPADHPEPAQAAQ